MNSAPPLHIDVAENDIPLQASNTAGKIIAVLSNPSNPDVVAVITERGFAVWNASDTASIEKDILTEHPEADPLTKGCWGDQGNSLFLVSGSRIIEFDCASNQIDLRLECPVSIVWMGWWTAQSVLVLVTEDKNISFFDFTKEKSFVHQIETKGYPSHADLNSTQNVLVVVENQTPTKQHITLYALSECSIYTSFQCPLSQPVSFISLAANGRRVAIGSEGGELVTRCFSIREEPKEPEHYTNQTGMVGCLREPKAHDGPVKYLAWSTKKEYLLASTGMDGKVTLFNTSSKKCLGSSEISSWPIMGATFMKDFLTLSIGAPASSSNPEEGPFTLLKALPSKFPK